MSHSKKGFLLLCFISLAAILNPLSRAESETTTGRSDSETVREEISPEVFSFYGVADLPSPVQITLKGTEVDLSQAIEGLNRIKQSDYDNFFQIHSVKYEVYSVIESLCRTLPKEHIGICQNKAFDTLYAASKSIEEEMQERIFYPYWYSENKNYIEEDFQDAMDSFSDPNCPLNCPPGLATRVITAGSQIQYSQLYDKIQHKNKNCQKNILKLLSRHLKEDRLPGGCLEEKNKSHAVCQNLLKYVNTIHNRSMELAELVYGIETVEKTEVQAPCMDCAEGVNPLNDLSLLFEDLEKQSQCFDLNSGEEKIVRSNTKSDPTENVSYLIKREPDGSYSIPLTLQFSPDEDYDGPVPREQVPEHYMNEVQRCINQANTKMLGPNGENLRIVIKEPEENDKDCETSDTINISIGSKDHRSNSRKYKQDIDCPTITHEILHLLGLCDEYHEKITGLYVNFQTGNIIKENYYRKIKDPEKAKEFKHKLSKGYILAPAYDCRVTSINNIMSDQYERWRFVFGPSGEAETPYSLLTPGQFNAVLYGGCEARNKLFNECSQLAYRSSIFNSDCFKKKEQCERQNALGQDKEKEEEEIQRIKEEADNLRKLLNAFNEQIDSIEKEGRTPSQAILSRVEEIKKEISSLEERLRSMESQSDP